MSDSDKSSSEDNNSSYDSGQENRSGYGSSRKSKNHSKKGEKAKGSEQNKQKLPGFSDKEVPRIVLLGGTGSGKSTLGNVLLGQKKFKVSNDPNSCTFETTSFTRGRWLGYSDGHEFEIMDTPGLNDSENRDTEIIHDIVTRLRHNKCVNMFLIVRNGQEVRMTNTYADMLRTFEMIFGDHFWKNAVFDVSNSLNEDNKKAAKKWVREIRNKFPKAVDVKTVFLDAKKEKSSKFSTNAEDLWNSCSQMASFACKDIKVVLAEKDRLEEEKMKLSLDFQAKTQEVEDFEKKLSEVKAREEKIEEENEKLRSQIQNHDAVAMKKDYDGQLKVMNMDFEKKIMEFRNEDKEKHDNEISILKAKHAEELQSKENDHRKEIEEKVEGNHDAVVMKKEYDSELKVMNIDFEKKIMESKNEDKEKHDNEISVLKSKHAVELQSKENEHRKEIEGKVEEARRRDLEITEKENKFKDQIFQLEKKHDQSELKAEIKKSCDEINGKEKQELIQNHDKEKQELNAKYESEKKELIQSNLAFQKELKAKYENEKIELIQKNDKEKQELINTEVIKKKHEILQMKLQSKAVEAEKQVYEHEVIKSEAEFNSRFPSLSSKLGPTPAVALFQEAKSSGQLRFEQNLHIELNQLQDIKNRKGKIAARIFETKYPKELADNEQNNHWYSGFWNAKKPEATGQHKTITKTFMLLGLTGSGKTSFVDSLMNFIFDTRYEDPYRLKLIKMTETEKEKNRKQAVSQTDHIVVYKVSCLPGMNINYNLTLVDTPGFGDTRGVDYDKELMQNIEDLFKSGTIDSLDAIGFVAKAGDARLTAQQNYIFESILHIFGKDVQDNLISILTNYDGQSINILDSFRAANMTFVEDFPVNSQAIFQPLLASGQTLDRTILIRQPQVAQYQQFCDEAARLTTSLLKLVPKSLTKTIAVLDDREKIQVEVQGVQSRVMELLMKKDQIQKETDICNQHAANAMANENFEYEVDEQKIVKIALDTGIYVTNCLKCNRTCHFPCGISEDSRKNGCAAMRGGMCTVCPGKCHWNQHVNNDNRIEFKVEKVKKTYAELVKRHAEFLNKHRGQKTVLDALKAEADAASKEIQDSVPRIRECLARLHENALRPTVGSSADYLQQMISTEDHERKPGYIERIAQLRQEQDKSRMLSAVQDGKDIMRAKTWQ